LFVFPPPPPPPPFFQGLIYFPLFSNDRFSEQQGSPNQPKSPGRLGHAGFVVAVGDLTLEPSRIGLATGPCRAAYVRAVQFPRALNRLHRGCRRHRRE
jgi:hypothetical protein